MTVLLLSYCPDRRLTLLAVQHTRKSSGLGQFDGMNMNLWLTSSSGVVGLLKADCHELVEVPTDEDGIIPSELRRILSGWPSGQPRPRVIYTTPTGSNPTGSSCPEIRKIEMYELHGAFDTYSQATRDLEAFRSD